MPIDTKTKRMDIASRVRVARKNAGMTQGDVAQNLGITPQAISNYERGINDIPNVVILKLAKLFNISAAFLLGTGGEWGETTLPLYQTAKRYRLMLGGLLESPNSSKETTDYINKVAPEIAADPKGEKLDRYIEDITALTAPFSKDNDTIAMETLFADLNDDGRRLAINYLTLLVENEKYTHRPANDT